MGRSRKTTSPSGGANPMRIANNFAKRRRSFMEWHRTCKALARLFVVIPCSLLEAVDVQERVPHISFSSLWRDCNMKLSRDSNHVGSTVRYGREKTCMSHCCFMPDVME